MFLFTYLGFYPIITEPLWREVIHEHIPGSLFFHEL